MGGKVTGRPQGAFPRAESPSSPAFVWLWKKKKKKTLAEVLLKYNGLIKIY